MERQEIFNRFRFKLPFYEFQQSLLTEIEQDLQQHDHYLLISPPGSGKTIIGLSLSQILGVHTLVLTPNLAVLGSWLDMASMFLESSEANLVAEVVGQEAGELHPITVLTYQKLNYELTLFNKELAKAMREEKTSKKKKATKTAKSTKADKAAKPAKPAKVAKPAKGVSEPHRTVATSLITRLQNYNIGLIICDEAHRLTNAWGDDVGQLVSLFPNAKILGLTATPPAKAKGVFASVFTETVRRIPLPPLVRAKITAPYRDLVYFIPEITPGEDSNATLKKVLNKYDTPQRNLLATITAKSQYDSEVQNHEIAYEDFLYFKGFKELQLKEFTSAKIIHSKWMLAHVLTIMKKEMETLNDNFRGMVLFDYEKGHANISKRVGMGGAIGFFEALVTDTITDILDPIFVTGKSLLVDDDATDRFLLNLKDWQQQHNKQFTIKTKNPVHKKYTIINGSGPDWNTETYTRYVTYLFENGLTKLLVGTRFLLGEGWDSRKLNVLFDLTVTTTYASVNQIKGRAFRRDPTDPTKVSHIWEFIPSPKYGSAAMQSYQNFFLRHRHYFGLDDKQNIRSGIKKFHNSLIDYPKTTSWWKIKRIEEQLLQINYKRVNKAMLQRINQRELSYQLWKVGEKIGTLTNTFVIPLSSDITRMDAKNFQQFKNALFIAFKQLSAVVLGNAEHFIRLNREEQTLAVHFNKINNESLLALYDAFNTIDFLQALEIRMDVVPFGIRRILYAGSKSLSGVLQRIAITLSQLLPPTSLHKQSFILPVAADFLSSDASEYTNVPLATLNPLVQIYAVKKEWLGKTHTPVYDHIGTVNLETRFID